MQKKYQATVPIWQLKKPVSQSVVAQFPEYPKAITQLLANRGLRDDQAIARFLSPSYTEDLHDPLLLSGLAGAADRLSQAIAAQQRIVVHGDYDADGITAAALLSEVLTQLGGTVSVFLPNRYQEGYGVAAATLRRLQREGAELVVTVDCGISNGEAIAESEAAGLPVIVTDHHLPPRKLPQCVAVVNPNLPRDPYPNKSLTGVGVAFKLAQQLLRQGTLSQRQQEATEKWLLDLVAIGTIADLAALTGENRALVRYGLTVLARCRRPGLAALMRVAGINRPTAQSIGFGLAPRLNAAGRLGDPSVALALVQAKDQPTAEALAAELQQLNQQRQTLTGEALEAARSQLGPVGDERRALVVDGTWSSGLAGLVAGRLVEEYHRPALVVERGKQVSVGSARSIAALNIVEALAAQKSLLSKFGGHAGAAGFSLPTEKLAAFRAAIERYASQHISAEDLVPTLAVEAVIEPDELSFSLLEFLEQFEPFGVDNPQPLLLLRRVTVTQRSSVGSRGEHLKLQVALENGHHLPAVCFRHEDRLRHTVRRGDLLDLVGYPVSNSFRNQQTLEWHVSDLRPSQ